MWGEAHTRSAVRCHLRDALGWSCGREEREGAALEPARRRCLLDLRQRARPFAICPLVGWGRGRDTDLAWSRSRPLPHPTKMNGSKGLCPLAEFQEAAPLGGVWGEAPALLLPTRLPQ